jgi:N utilization substance protein A
MLNIKQIKQAIAIMSKEKNINEWKLVEIIESALKTAYRKDYWNKDEDVDVKIDLENETFEITVKKTVVKEVTNPALEISFEELWEDASSFKEWDVVGLDVTEEVQSGDQAESFWRIASQAARQVIIQKIWESEREKIYDLFVWKEWQIINVKIEMVDWNKVIFDYQWAQIILSKNEQVSRDNYVAWARFYLYIAEVSKSENGTPKVILSRKRPELVIWIFAEHVPEIADWIINIDKIVRQPWVKTKILVSSNYEEIEAIWTLIGQKWMRVKAVMEELWWEKIDIIPNSLDVREVIKKSLSPAEVIKVDIVDEEEKEAVAYILPTERAKALWKNGLNVSLASKLTGYKISVEDVEVDDD